MNRIPTDIPPMVTCKILRGISKDSLGDFPIFFRTSSKDSYRCSLHHELIQYLFQEYFQEFILVFHWKFSKQCAQDFFSKFLHDLFQQFLQKFRHEFLFVFSYKLLQDFLKKDFLVFLQVYFQEFNQKFPGISNTNSSSFLGIFSRNIHLC